MHNYYYCIIYQHNKLLYVWIMRCIIFPLPYSSDIKFRALGKLTQKKCDK